MLILQSSQVEPCPVLRKNIFEEVLLPGLSYQGKLFFRVARYSQPLKSQATQTAKKLLAQGQDNFSILLVSAKDQITVWQEDPELLPCSAKQAKIKRIQQMDLAKIVKRMHGTDGLAMRDRRQGLRRQKYCFIAKEMAKWLSKTYHLTDNDGIRLAQRMLDAKLMYNLGHREVFKANGDFYRFYDDEIC